MKERKKGFIMGEERCGERQMMKDEWQGRGFLTEPTRSLQPQLALTPLPLLDVSERKCQPEHSIYTRVFFSPFPSFFKIKTMSVL